MKTRDIITGFVVLVLFTAGILLIVRAKNSKKVETTPIPTPNFQQIESKFPALSVPENADRAGLSDVSGGSAMGEAWRTYENGKFSLTVIADLPALTQGLSYQAWISNGGSPVSVGRLELGKGGFIVNFSADKDYSSFKKVAVTLERVSDGKPETSILEGSF